MLKWISRTKFILGLGIIFAASVMVSEINAESAKVLYLSKEEILTAEEEDYAGVKFLKWEGYKSSETKEHDGIIPTYLLSDEIYCSMNLPSESRWNDMIKWKRDNGEVMCKMSKEHSSLVGIGTIYQTAEKDLPDKFTLCIGKIKTFVYLKSVNNWVLLDEQPYPKGIYLYKMPWKENIKKKCDKMTTYPDHIEVEMTKEEFSGYALHFWGQRKNVKQEDVLYVACAYEFWIKEKGNDGDFTAMIGVDAKDANGSQESISQLFCSRGLEVTTQKRAHWGHTIPNAEYDELYDGYVLKLLFDKWWNISK